VKESDIIKKVASIMDKHDPSRKSYYQWERRLVEKTKKLQ
jgi:hypothetical protein